MTPAPSPAVAPPSRAGGAGPGRIAPNRTRTGSAVPTLRCAPGPLWRVDGGAGIAGLSMRTEETRAPGPGEVAVAVHAVSLSFRELLVLRGRYPLAVKADLIPVSDGAGEVVAVGAGVEGVRPGDRVELLVPFRDFTGRTVYHCHIAEHGDIGMIGVIEVSA